MHLCALLSRLLSNHLRRRITWGRFEKKMSAMMEEDQGQGSGGVRKNPSFSNSITPRETPDKKRTRSGTIVRRLRSISDLEEGGWISRVQKECMKELVMRGDERLLSAMDSYDGGNVEFLQSMIVSGELNSVPLMMDDMDIVNELEAEMQQGCTVIARTCRICHQQFTMNHDKACAYHPESYCGETGTITLRSILYNPSLITPTTVIYTTAQRWLPPGETKGGGIVHNFYSCCGATDVNAPGCCARKHFTYDTDDMPGLVIPQQHSAFKHIYHHLLFFIYIVH